MLWAATLSLRRSWSSSRPLIAQTTSFKCEDNSVSSNSEWNADPAVPATVSAEDMTAKLFCDGVAFRVKDRPPILPQLSLEPILMAQMSAVGGELRARHPAATSSDRRRRVHRSEEARVLIG